MSRAVSRQAPPGGPESLQPDGNLFRIHDEFSPLLSLGSFTLGESGAAAQSRPAPRPGADGRGGRRHPGAPLAAETERPAPGIEGSIGDGQEALPPLCKTARSHDGVTPWSCVCRTGKGGAGAAAHMATMPLAAEAG